MENVKAIVLRAAGINCDMETQHALQMAGAQADRIHINRIIEDVSILDNYQILVFPGGFSYGDDVAAGKILANQVAHHLSGALKKFVADGKLVLGICNGFQVLVKTGILPGFDLDLIGDMASQKLSIINNDCGRFQDRWVHLKCVSNKCVFTDIDRVVYFPIAHGEGKVVTKDDETLKRILDSDMVAFKYVDADGNEGGFPVNPNGSFASIAGLTDSTGRVLGLMPHPERIVHHTQHPHWTRNRDNCADGTMVFDNAVKYVREKL